MHFKSVIIAIVSAVICACLILFAVLSYSSFKNTERDFNQKKVVLVRENLDLKDRLDSIQALLDKKSESVNVLEKEKTELESAVTSLKKENEKIIGTYSEQLETLKKKSAILKKKIRTLENTPLIQRLKEATESEERSDVKQVLDYAITKITMIKEGKSVELEPIVVSKKEGPAVELMSAPASGQTISPDDKTGAILSVEKKNNLIVVSLGRKDEVKEGDRLKIIKDNTEIAGAEIISVRYRISAAALDDFLPKYRISDIKENDKVLLVKQ